MPFVIYDKKSTRILRTKGAQQDSYETMAAAKAALTRSVGQIDRCRDLPVKKDNYAIAESTRFFNKIEKKEVRHGIVGSNGKKFKVGVNTPWTSGPWSETYWSS